MALADPIADDEMLYRSVRPMHFTFHEGRYVTTPEAFSDRTQKISFDRARLSTPESSRMGEDQAIFGLTAGEVRAIEGAKIHETAFCIEVYASPLPLNFAHAHVAAADAKGNELLLPDTAFRRLKKRISEVASLVLPPT